ncbi:MAG: phosphoribosylglycinamide formyltransferase [Deltaproteobacteria bacterium]|nr:phosphoribosylglycinamide formyltransferase [Deltaproteobacteria bacterium]
MPVSVGVMASGRGTNLQAIIDAIAARSLDAAIKVVISDNPGAFAIGRAEKHGIKTAVVTKDQYPLNEDFEKKLISTLNASGVELVALAGFMRVLSPLFIRAFPMRIMNVHPSLLPAFTGLSVQKKALEYGVKFSGCTVHFVDEGVDTGPIIIQAVVKVMDDDTPETLAERILLEEHRIYPQAIQLFSEGRLEVKGRKVFVHGVARGTVDEPLSLENPLATIFNSSPSKKTRKTR